MMIHLKTIYTTIGILAVLAVFAQCASSYKIDKTAPAHIKNPYFKKWNSGIKEKGFTVYLPVDKNTPLKLKYVYFKGKKIELEHHFNEAVYIGHYTYPPKRDLVMSIDPKEEFKNNLPVIEEKIPFELAGNECVIEYMREGKKRYFNSNLTEKSK